MVADRVGETPCVFLAGLHRAERTVAERLMRLANGKLPWPWIDPDKALPWAEARIGLALAESQIAAIRRGGVGARSLNIELQAALNPAGERKVERFGWTFAPGDKVMQIENDYDKEVYNGDIGFVADVEPEEGEPHRQLRRALGHLRLWRARRPSAGIRREHPQEPRLGIPSGGDSGHDAALRHVAA